MDVRRAFCCGLRERRAEISFGSATGVVEAGGVVELPGSVPVVVPVPPADPLPLVDDVVVAGVEAAADFFVDPAFAVLSDFTPPDLSDFAPPDTFPASVPLPDVVLPDIFGDPLVLDDAVVVELFGPPFGACTLAFGPFDASAVAGAIIVMPATDSPNEITSG
jgi:hypothetical protein